MESLNAELVKLVKKQLEADAKNQEQVVKNKDYTQIYNTLVHMLEEPNMLVFIEAIKMVEYLSIICRGSIKQAKMKQFVSLLADKYKETKTAVLAALERTFDVIFEYKSLGQNQMIDQLVNHIAITHKNPRVKQMVIDRVELLVNKFFLSEDQSHVLNEQ